MGEQELVMSGTKKKIKLPKEIKAVTNVRVLIDKREYLEIIKKAVNETGYLKLILYPWDPHDYYEAVHESLRKKVQDPKHEVDLDKVLKNLTVYTKVKNSSVDLECLTEERVCWCIRVSLKSGHPNSRVRNQFLMDFKKRHKEEFRRVYGIYPWWQEYDQWFSLSHKRTKGKDDDPKKRKKKKKTQ
jgi:hypothetical protein